MNYENCIKHSFSRPMKLKPLDTVFRLDLCSHKVEWVCDLK